MNLDSVHLRDVLTIWTIAGLPRELPRAYSLTPVYVFEGEATPGPARVFPSLEVARASVPPGCVRLERAVDDDPTILEVWM